MSAVITGSEQSGQGAVRPPAPVVVAVDGGGSKTDAVAVRLDGSVVARARAGGSSPQNEGLARSVEVVDALVREVAGTAPLAGVDLFLSGLDFPEEEAAYRQGIADLPWAPGALLDNDLFAVLRAGTSAEAAVAVVCGTGINAVGLGHGGARVRFPAVGAISGDWGGGSGLGSEALWHAARAADGRGPATALTEGICRVLDVASVPELIADLHFGRRSHGDLRLLAPEVFRASDAGDAVAGALVDRQADEVAALVTASVRRLDLVDEAFPVVLGGSVLQAGHRRLEDRIAARVHDVAPRADLLHLRVPPVVGAVLRALERAGADSVALARAEAELAGTAADLVGGAAR
ncbi:MAG: hypothetical protein PGN11_10825 [Quadrisphaera sp.]